MNNKEYYINKLKTAMIEHENDPEMIHAIYDDIMTEMISEEIDFGKEFIKEADEILVDTPFWYA